MGSGARHTIIWRQKPATEGAGLLGKQRCFETLSAKAHCAMCVAWFSKHQSVTFVSLSEQAGQGLS